MQTYAQWSCRLSHVKNARKISMQRTREVWNVFCVPTVLRQVCVRVYVLVHMRLCVDIFNVLIHIFFMCWYIRVNVLIHMCLYLCVCMLTHVIYLWLYIGTYMSVCWYCLCVNTYIFNVLIYTSQRFDTRDIFMCLYVCVYILTHVIHSCLYVGTYVSVCWYFLCINAYIFNVLIYIFYMCWYTRVNVLIHVIYMCLYVCVYILTHVIHSCLYIGTYMSVCWYFICVNTCIFYVLIYTSQRFDTRDIHVSIRMCLVDTCQVSSHRHICRYNI